MLFSHPRTITYRGQPAELRVVRNNGECWGLVSTAEGDRLDVVSDDDLYDSTDEEALDALEVLSAMEPHVEHSLVLMNASW